MGTSPEISLRMLYKGFSLANNGSYISMPDFLIFDKGKFEYKQLSCLKNVTFDL